MYLFSFFTNNYIINGIMKRKVLLYTLYITLSMHATHETSSDLQQSPHNQYTKPILHMTPQKYASISSPVNSSKPAISVALMHKIMHALPATQRAISAMTEHVNTQTLSPDTQFSTPTTVNNITNISDLSTSNTSQYSVSSSLSHSMQSFAHHDTSELIIGRPFSSNNVKMTFTCAFNNNQQGLQQQTELLMQLHAMDSLTSLPFTHNESRFALHIDMYNPELCSSVTNIISWCIQHSITEHTYKPICLKFFGDRNIILAYMKTYLYKLHVAKIDHVNYACDGYTVCKLYPQKSAQQASPESVNEALESASTSPRLSQQSEIDACAEDNDLASAILPSCYDECNINDISSNALSDTIDITSATRSPEEHSKHLL